MFLSELLKVPKSHSNLEHQPGWGTVLAVEDSTTLQMMSSPEELIKQGAGCTNGGNILSHGT